MVTTCCAFNCASRASKNPNDERVTFHNFPKNKQLLKKWVAALRRKDWNPSKYSRLCSLHFTADSYDTSGWSSRPKLKSDAVPTVFDFPTLAKKFVPPRPPPRERNLLPTQTDTVHDKSPPVPIELYEYLLPDDEFDVSVETITHDLPPFSPEVVIEVQPPVKKRRRCFVGDFEDDVSNLSTDDTNSFTTVAKNLLIKKNKQLRLLRQKNRRLEKKISDLESLLEKVITDRVNQ